VATELWLSRLRSTTFILITSGSFWLSDYFTAKINPRHTDCWRGLVFIFILVIL
jgi:hypothetical protein